MRSSFIRQSWVMLLAFSLFLSVTTTVKALSSPLSSSTEASTRVQVQVTRALPELSTPQEARRAWLLFVWEGGGGLPIGVFSKAERSPTSGDDGLETTLQRRQLLPIFMEEELLVAKDNKATHLDSLSSNNDSSSLCQIKYQVTNSGLLSTEIMPGSHLGIVTFSTATTGSTGIQLTWDVHFDTTSASRTFLWQSVTEQTITDTCNNFQAAMAKPKLYSRTTILRCKTRSDDDESNKELLQHVMDQWIQFCWVEGAGFPLPIPPVRLGGGGGDDDNDNQLTRWIIPPFLKETLLSNELIVTDEGARAEIQYQVDNPSMFTYQVFSHMGRIQFVLDTTEEDTTKSDKSDDNAVIRMIWDIEIRPYHGWSDFVQAFTGAVVSCYARNFKCHVQEGADATVALKPPRGGGVDGETLWQVRKDSWVGGVLNSHLKDRRSTAEQTIALFQPWTWGRSKDYDEQGEGEEWVEGYMSDS